VKFVLWGQHTDSLVVDETMDFKITGQETSWRHWLHPGWKTWRHAYCECYQSSRHFCRFAIFSTLKGWYWSINWSNCFKNMTKPRQCIQGKCFSSLFCIFLHL
jgi:hypothetical protein